MVYIGNAIDNFTFITPEHHTDLLFAKDLLKGFKCSLVVEQRYVNRILYPLLMVLSFFVVLCEPSFDGF